MMAKDGGGQRLRVNPLACHAHGVCIEALPEMIGKDPWGYPVLSDQTIPDHLLHHARLAAAACPTLALKLVNAGQATRR
ncbi:MAG TPA: ferredoxin [Actinocrinis sp.]|nr:ferredoxin [Actinocrinis sp.]